MLLNGLWRKCGLLEDCTLRHHVVLAGLHSSIILSGTAEWPAHDAEQVQLAATGVMLVCDSGSRAGSRRAAVVRLEKACSAAGGRLGASQQLQRGPLKGGIRVLAHQDVARTTRTQLFRIRTQLADQDAACRTSKAGRASG
jgi:hypothetical protein